MPPLPDGPTPYLLRLLRHGATTANTAGLRCGGDLDLPLTDAGRQQARDAGARLRRLQPAPGLIVTSDLQRTRETAAIVAVSFPGVPVIVEPAFAERLLGQWNLQPVALTQTWLDAGCTPPGGESDAEFVDRIAQGLRRIRPHLPLHPLLVGSKGVARALGVLAGSPRTTDLDNGEITEFELHRDAVLHTAQGTP